MVPVAKTSTTLPILVSMFAVASCTSTLVFEVARFDEK